MEASPFLIKNIILSFNVLIICFSNQEKLKVTFCDLDQHYSTIS